jgi:type I restriction enzyme, S subunit
MSLLDAQLGEDRHWSRVGDGYEVTKKLRGLDRATFPKIPFAAMEAIPQDGSYLPAFTMKAPETIASGTYFERGDILIGKITPSFENGKQALIQELDAPFGYATTEVIPLHPRSNQHDPRFLFFYLLHPDVRHYVTERMEGSTGRKRVPEDVLLDLPIPNTGLDEQIAIADSLEAVQLASALESHSERASRNLKRAAMRDLFTKGLRRDPQVETEFGLVPETWLSMALDDCAKVQTGVAKGRKFENAEMVDVPYLRVANVQDGHLDLSEMKLIHIRRSEVERYRLQTGDVVLTEGGDFDKLGRGFIWRGELDLCVHQNHVFAVRPDRKRLLPDFFAYLAQSAYGKAYFLKVAHKTTNLACINSTKLKAFPVLIPPTLDEQREIVEILDAIDRKISLHQRKRAVLEDLFKALLHKLMTGKIRVADLDLSVLGEATLEGVAA